MAAKRLLDGMPYTPAANTTADYLRAKFKRIQRELEAKKKPEAAKVTPIKPVLKSNS